MTSEASFSHMRDNILTASFVNTVGYLGTSLCGGVAAAAVGGTGSMLAVSAVGSAGLYFPIMLLRQALEAMDLMNNLISTVISCAYMIGSAALGAAMLGLAVQPVIMCALVGVIVCACLGLFTSPKDEVSETPVVQNRHHTFSVTQPDVERNDYLDEELGYRVSEVL